MIEMPYPASNTQPKTIRVDAKLLRLAPFVAYIDLQLTAPQTYEAKVQASIALGVPVDEIAVRCSPSGGYEILAGMPAYYAFREIYPLSKIDVAVYDYTDEEAVFVAIEINVKRFDIDAITHAEACKNAMDHFNWTQTKLAKALNSKQSTVGNNQRLLNLTSSVKKLVRAGQISRWQAKTLCSLSLQQQELKAREITLRKTNTRALYKQANPHYQSAIGKHSNAGQGQPIYQQDGPTQLVENEIAEALGTPVQLNLDKENGYRGQMSLQFFSISELKQLVDRLEKNATEEELYRGSLTLQINNNSALQKIRKDTLGVDELDELERQSYQIYLDESV